VEFITNAPEHPRFIGRWIEMFERYCEERDALDGDNNL
jgi:hypothetical protein